MSNFLVTIEFRYTGNSTVHHWIKDSHISDTYTIGIYETFEEACKGGNDVLVMMETKYKTHNKGRFSKNGGAFGRPNTLITNLGYLNTPFQFFAKIVPLVKFDSENTINKVLEAMNKSK